MSKYIIRTEKKKHRTKLSDILKDADINQVKLAESSKLAISQISNIVSGGQTDMFLTTAKKICNSLNRSLDEVFGEGRIDFKTQMLNYLSEEAKRLPEGDIYGNLWLEKFKKAVTKMV